MVIQEQETASKLAEKLIMSMTAIENKVAHLEGTAVQVMANIQATAAQTTPIEEHASRWLKANVLGTCKPWALTKQSSECGMRSS